MEYGDPGGHPVINCHGGLVCRLDIQPASPAAEAAGIRIISPDRPGIGLSSAYPGRTISDWVADAAALADQLGLERFSVLGWSMGAPYALACAAHLADRVCSVVVVGGGVPLDWPCAGGEFANRGDAVILGLARRRPASARLLLRAAGTLAARTPRIWVRLSFGSLAPCDRRTIERAGARWYARSTAEGLRRPQGVVDDYLAYVAPWGFSYDQVAAPASVWQGTEDLLVPSSWSQEAAARLGAPLRSVAGAGHFVAFDRWADVFGDVDLSASAG